MKAPSPWGRQVALSRYVSDAGAFRIADVDVGFFGSPSAKVWTHFGLIVRGGEVSGMMFCDRDGPWPLSFAYLVALVMFPGDESEEGPSPVAAGSAHSVAAKAVAVLGERAPRVLVRLAKDAPRIVRMEDFGRACAEERTSG